MVDALVIGSGYGGSVMAARLSERMRVMLVERGRRWRAGDFPRSLPQLAAARLSRRNPLGLWGMRFGAGTGNALVQGYGGASLVNYGITAQPEAHVFEQWPLSAAELAPYFERARQVLRPSPNPIAGELADWRVLDRLAPGKRVDLENTIDWRRCSQCGNCVPGCNEQAKRSLDLTYLALAERHGAEIVSETEVRWCQKHPEGGWELTLGRTGGGQEHKVRARRVVLAAGTFGSLDFLRRHQREIPTTRMFGQRMSMNGDSLAFLYNTPLPQSGRHGAPISTSVRLPFVDPQGRVRTLTVMAGRLPAIAMRPPDACSRCSPGWFKGKGWARMKAWRNAAVDACAICWPAVTTGVWSAR
jgi:cholesterol oxidase